MPSGPTHNGVHRGRYLILHGWQNDKPREHWQHRLADDLKALGHQVLYPQLPSPNRPVLKEWLAEIAAQLADTVPTELTVVCHSLACIAWMNLSEQDTLDLPVHRLLFVAPPGPDLLARTDELSGFTLPPYLHEAITSSVATQPRLACADDDPYCLERADRAYPGIFDIDIVANARHFDIPAGYGEWPSVVEWCLDPETRLRAALHE